MEADEPAARAELAALTDILLRVREIEPERRLAVLQMALLVAAQEHLNNRLKESHADFEKAQAAIVLALHNMRQLLAGPPDLDSARQQFEMEGAVDDRDVDAARRVLDELRRRLDEKGGA